VAFPPIVGLSLRETVPFSALSFVAAMVA